MLYWRLYFYSNRQGMTVPPKDSNSGLERLSQQALDEVMKKHVTFLKGIRGGARAVLKFKDLSNLDFKGSDLSQADFTGSVLQNAILRKGTFKGVSFFACDLRNANLEDADFTRADFRGAYVAGANLKGADMASADLREGKVMEKGHRGILEDKKMSDDRVGSAAQRTIFSGAKLRETNLSGSRASAADFSDADLSGVVVKDADFRGANMEGANLSDADFTGSNLSKANLASSIMTGTILEAAETGGSNINEALTDEAMGEKVEDIAATLPEMLDKHATWVKTAGGQGERLDLSGYDLRKIENLSARPLTALKAVGANFLRQDLEGAQIQSALLDRSDFRDANMKDIDLRGTSLKNAMLSRADLSGANLTPLHFKNPDGSEWLQRVNLSGANLRYAVLNGAQLNDAILNGADLSYAIMIDCDLRRADLSGVLLDGADMSGSNTADADIDERYRKDD